MERVERVARVKERRKLVDAEQWVCERCGQTSEEGLCIVTTGRCTRSDPHGERELFMCGGCLEGGRLHGRVVMT